MAERTTIDEASPVAAPGTSRGRSGTLIPSAECPVLQEEASEEHLNIPTQRRQDLLHELARALNTDKVPASFWACVQVCDLGKLEEFIHQAKPPPSLVSCFMKSCHSIPRTWMQRPPRAPEGSTSTSTSGESASKRRRREKTPKDLALERDRGLCVVTKCGPIDMAHIYPNCLIYPSRSRSAFDESIPEFWEILSIFWSPEQIQRWRSKIFRDSADPTKPADACFNLICLGPGVHRMWGDGAFALRPLDYNNNMTELEVEWYWQPKQDHGPRDIVSLTKIPPSSRDLDSVVNRDNIIFRLFFESSPGEITSIKSGQKLVLKTSDPERLPLPSKELLELQWHLNRIVSMSAAAEDRDDNDDDDDDDDGGSILLPEDRRRNVETWVESSVLPTPALPPLASSVHPRSPSPALPSSHSDSESGSDEFHHSITTTSTGPSPVKTRDTVVQSMEQSVSSREQSLLSPPVNK